jgi:GT2 family glycosyltransferase
MNRPLVSIILETVTPQTSVAGDRLASRLAGPLAAIAGQTYPQNLIEPIVAIGEEIGAEERGEIARRYPQVRLATAAANNYFDPKNRGAAAASGEIVTFLDGDCTPEPDWLEKLIARFDCNVDGVAGCVRYDRGSRVARALSVPVFAYILTEEDGLASGINIGNAAFRREILLANPLDARLIRNGGCYNLFHSLRAQGARIVYAPDAKVWHALDFTGLGFLGKHWARGRDGLNVYRYDERGLFRGTRWYRRLGPLALMALSARRVLVDWRRLARHRRQMGVSLPALPAYAALGAGLRLVELAGSIAASLRPAPDVSALVEAGAVPAAGARGQA